MGVDLVQTVLDGLMVGGLYATVALGITLVFGILGVLNFAHGQMVMLGAYAAFFAVSAGLGFWLGLALAMIVSGALGLVLERALFRHVLTDPMAGLTVSLGLIMVIENIAAAAFTPDSRFLEPPFSGSVSLGPIVLPQQRLFVLALVVVLVGLSVLLLRHTRYGKAVRAMGQNRTGAALVGIRTAEVTAIVFTVGSALAGAAGALYASLFAISPYMAGAPLMKGFILTVLGGLGSVTGAIVAGILLGLAESFGSRYLSASFRDGYGFILLIAALLFFPAGLFGRHVARI